MSAKIVKFRKKNKFDAAQDFKRFIASTKEDESYASEYEKKILKHMMSVMIGNANIEPKAMRYYFKKILGYNKSDMEAILEAYSKVDIFTVLASYFLSQEWLGMERFRD